MKKLEIDWSYFSDALIALMVCLAVSFLMIWYSSYFKQHYKTAYDYSHTRFRENSERYLSIDDEMKIIREKYPRFLKMYGKGILGKENRLNWMETLRAAGNAIQMPDLRYEIKSQETANPAYLGAVNKGNFEVYSSTMHLDLGLLHEYDLSALLDDLNARAKGLYSVSRCTMSRKAGELVIDASIANISAACDLDWYTLNLPGDGLVLPK